MAHFEAKYKIGTLIEFNTSKDKIESYNTLAKIESVKFTNDPPVISYVVREVNKFDDAIEVDESDIVCELKRV